MATLISRRLVEAVGDQVIELRDVDWKGYRAALKLRGARPSPRVIYLDGSLLLVSPSFPHERLKERLARLITEVVVGLDIRCIPAGQTTFRRRSRRGGIEGDLTYYLARAAAVAGKDRIDPLVDPPPDLAVEVVFSHAATAAVATYRRLGVPEVWVCEANVARILVRRADGRYAESPVSSAFPFLAAAEILDWPRRPDGDDETPWVRDVRHWVRDVLAPRHRPAGA